MRRAKDIQEKLTYALEEYKELQKKVSDAQKNDTSIRFIGQKVGSILSACHECFDYCANDIVDTFVIGYTTKQNFINQHRKGKLRVHFPYNSVPLTNNGNSLSELKTTKKELYDYLDNLIKKFENKDVIPNTIISYYTALELNNIVNSKKHTEITEINERKNSATRISFPNGGEVTVSPMFNVNDGMPNFSADMDASPFSGQDDVNIEYVKEFKITFNNWEVTRFCMHSIQATFQIFSDIYYSFYNIY